MKIVVLMKQTFDTEAKIELDGKGEIMQTDIKRIMNPYDEYAVEEAVRIKEARGGEIIVVSLGADTVIEALRQALAMGCDRAVLINDSGLLGGDEYSSANAIAAAVKQLEYDLILAGWVAVDDGSAQVAVRVAEILNIPQITMASKLQLENETAIGQREIEGGMMKVEVPLPAMITVQKGINEPRYPTMKGIITARKKEIKALSGADLEIDPTEIGKAGAKAVVREIFFPPKRQACKIIKEENPEDAVNKLAQLLHEEAKVI